MATNPDPPPDRIEPHAPPESPPTPVPAEQPASPNPELVPPEPDFDRPDKYPGEWRMPTWSHPWLIR